MGAQSLNVPAALVGQKINKKTVLSEGYRRPLYKIKETLQRLDIKTPERLLIVGCLYNCSNSEKSDNMA